MTKLEKYKRLQKCPSWFQSSSSQGSSVWRNFQIKSEKKMQRIFLETDPAIALSRSRFLSATKTNIQAENNTEVQQRQLPAGLCPSIRQIAHVFALHFLFCPHHLFFFFFFPHWRGCGPAAVCTVWLQHVSGGVCIRCHTGTDISLLLNPMWLLQYTRSWLSGLF